MSLFPQIFTPEEIRRTIGLSLMEEPFQTFVFDHNSVATWFEDDDIYDDVPADQIREAAERAREQHRHDAPSNVFRETSRVIKDTKWSYWFEWELTDAGYHAREHALRQVCCDDEGRFAEAETIKFWLTELGRVAAHEPRSRITEILHGVVWLDEPWAEPIRRAAEILRRDHIAIGPTGEADYTKTFNQFARLTDKKLLTFKNYFFRLDDEWASPIQQHIMVVLFKQPPKKLVNAA